ncbi:ciliary microtubule inner protein 1 isoform X1 [Pithys albifrons albifrons]|uniref:ciliary microtubule inner protein 1 isoform X1 n=1 Tax=Pithys albifrons albifrons TaxID=3385563 RepID=UPI003A5CB491
MEKLQPHLSPSLPQPASGKPEGTFSNQFSADGALCTPLKKCVEKEGDAAKRWSDKWGFLRTPLEELIGDEKKEDAKPKIELPEHLRIRPVTPVEKYIKVLPSPPVPKTTQGFIGWRSAVPGLELEIDYQIQSCKGTLCRDLY